MRGRSSNLPLTKLGMRPDGRSASSLRELNVAFEKLDRVDGSGTFSFGDTRAIASVSGPIQVRLAAELPSKAAFEVTIRPLSGIPGMAHCNSILLFYY